MKKQRSIPRIEGDAEGLNKRLSKCECPIRSPANILSWFLLGLRISSAFFFCRGFFREDLSSLLFMYGLSAPHVSYLCSPWSPSWQPLQLYQLQAQVLLVDVRSLAINSHVSRHPYQSDSVMSCRLHRGLIAVQD